MGRIFGSATTLCFIKLLAFSLERVLKQPDLPTSAAKKKEERKGGKTEDVVGLATDPLNKLINEMLK